MSQTTEGERQDRVDATLLPLWEVAGRIIGIVCLVIMLGLLIWAVVGSVVPLDGPPQPGDQF